jgi:uncharacterized protein YfdQ (DUF2303 family)
MIEGNRNGVVLEAGRLLERMALSQAPKGCTPYLVKPDGSVKSMEKLLDAPRRVRATVSARTAKGLIDYVKIHHTPGTTVFAWAGDGSFAAVIDYHQAAAAVAPLPPATTVGDKLVQEVVATFPSDAAPAQPSWCSHRVDLTLKLSQDWQRWMQANKKPMGQEEFAMFIEDNTHNIAKPAGADLFEMARQLYATKSVNFGSSVRLDNGQHQLRYEETITGSAGKKGQFTIPTEFTLGLPPFEGSALHEVTARFRYRIDNGTLKLWYDLLRPEVVVDTAYLSEREKIAMAMLELGVPVIDGKFLPLDSEV